EAMQRAVRRPVHRALDHGGVEDPAVGVAHGVRVTTMIEAPNRGARIPIETPRRPGAARELREHEAIVACQNRYPDVGLCTGRLPALLPLGIERIDRSFEAAPVGRAVRDERLIADVPDPERPLLGAGGALESKERALGGTALVVEEHDVGAFPRDHRPPRSDPALLLQAELPHQFEPGGDGTHDAAKYIQAPRIRGHPKSGEEVAQVSSQTCERLSLGP